MENRPAATNTKNGRGGPIIHRSIGTGARKATSTGAGTSRNDTGTAPAGPRARAWRPKIPLWRRGGQKQTLERKRANPSPNRRAHTHPVPIGESRAIHPAKNPRDRQKEKQRDSQGNAADSSQNPINRTRIADGLHVERKQSPQAQGKKGEAPPGDPNRRRQPPAQRLDRCKRHHPLPLKFTPFQPRISESNHHLPRQI